VSPDIISKKVTTRMLMKLTQQIIHIIWIQGKEILLVPNIVTSLIAQRFREKQQIG